MQKMFIFKLLFVWILQKIKNQNKINCFKTMRKYFILFIPNKGDKKFHYYKIYLK